MFRSTEEREEDLTGGFVPHAQARPDDLEEGEVPLERFHCARRVEAKEVYACELLKEAPQAETSRRLRRAECKGEGDRKASCRGEEESERPRAHREGHEVAREHRQRRYAPRLRRACLISHPSCRRPTPHPRPQARGRCDPSLQIQSNGRTSRDVYASASAIPIPDEQV